MSPPRSWSLSSLSLSSSLLPTLLLVLCPLPPRASCYFADWSSLDPRDGEPLCVRIPRNLTLCHDIGYTKMRLPNLLDHDTMQEVSQQASSWVPLLNIKCHADSKLFLCSLFAPVCLERPIYPCRSLCEKVKAGCEGTMSTYGFPWPAMLECDKFPVDNDMCIAAQSENKNDRARLGQQQQQGQRQVPSGRGGGVRNRWGDGGGGDGDGDGGHRQEGGNLCDSRPCNQVSTYENILDNFCQADFVVKMKFRRAKGRTLQGRKANSVFKAWPGTSHELRKLRKPRIKLSQADECCAEMIKKQAKQQRYLVMGKKGTEGSAEAGELFATFLLPWSKDKALRRARRMFKRIDCSDLPRSSQRLMRHAFAPRSPFAADPSEVHRQRRRRQHQGGLFFQQNRRRRKKGRGDRRKNRRNRGKKEEEEEDQF